MKDDFDEITTYLSPAYYFFGFPFMVGGGRDDKYIYSAISGLKYSYTPLGELNGNITPRLQKIATAFEEADLRPEISSQIKVWLIEVCAMSGIDPKAEKANKLYFLPLYIRVPTAKKVFVNGVLIIMFDRHTRHSLSEIKKNARGYY